LETNDNILNFPKSDNKRFDAALVSYRNKELRVALDEAISLVNDGYAHANTLVGAIYEKGGHEVEQDFDKAKFYYQMAVDKVGAVEAWLALGRLHFFGKGMAPDYEKAFYYYSVVDQDAESPVAYLMLGRMYQEAKGVRKDLRRAREYFLKAKAKGSVFALTHLALLEKECGNHLKSIWLRVQAAYLAFVVTRNDSFDSRLRRR
jgi:TPR repeat protein